MITEDSVLKYKQIYESEYGKEISDQDARDELTALVVLLSAVEKYKNIS